MANVPFITTTLDLQSGFTQALQLAKTEKVYLANWATQLAGNITGLDAVAMLGNLNQAIPLFTSIGALPGIVAYSQNQYANAGYDVATAFTTMVTALTAIQSWLKTNVPGNAVSISNGVLVGVTYTPTQTAGLLTLVNAASATIG
jgi:hypothetical protein